MKKLVCLLLSISILLSIPVAIAEDQIGRNAYSFLINFYPQLFFYSKIAGFEPDFNTYDSPFLAINDEPKKNAWSSYKDFYKLVFISNHYISNSDAWHGYMYFDDNNIIQRIEYTIPKDYLSNKVFVATLLTTILVLVPDPHAPYIYTRRTISEELTNKITEMVQTSKNAPVQFGDYVGYLEIGKDRYTIALDLKK